MIILPLTKLLISASQDASGMSNATGLVEDWNKLINDKSIEILQKSHKGIFCFLAFDHVIDKELLEYIENGGLASETGASLIMLYIVNKYISSSFIANDQEIFDILSIKSELNPTIEIIKYVFDEKFQPLLPGIIIYDNIIGSKKAIYISLVNKTYSNKIDCLRSIMKIIYDKSIKDYEENKSIVDKLSTAFAINDFNFEKNSNRTFSEFIINTFRAIWKLKGDIISIFT